MVQQREMSVVPGVRPGVAPAPRPTDVWHDGIGGSIDSVHEEIDDAFADLRTFYQNEPDHVMRLAGGHSARMSELRVRIMRHEDWSPEWKPVRTREIEPLLDELKNQFIIASRLFSVRELDYKIEAGER